MPRSSSLTLMLAFGLAISLGGCDRQSSDPAQPQERTDPAPDGTLTGKLDRSFAGSQMPDFTTTDPTGRQLDFSSLRGEPVLLNLWATWCAPCVVEMPLLDALAGQYKGSLRLITVSEDMKGAEVVAPFFAEKGFSHLEAWLDTESDLAFKLSEGSGLPTTVLYDAQGREVWRVAGGFDWTDPKVRPLIEEGFAKAANQ